MIASLDIPDHVFLESRRNIGSNSHIQNLCNQDVFLGYILQISSDLLFITPWTFYLIRILQTSACRSHVISIASNDTSSSNRDIPPHTAISSFNP